MPMLALAVKCVSLARIAGTLVETYRGRDAGQRVLKGLIRRGVSDRISAVLWYSDLRGFTRITDQSPPEQIIPLLSGRVLHDPRLTVAFQNHQASATIGALGTCLRHEALVFVQSVRAGDDRGPVRH